MKIYHLAVCLALLGGVIIERSLADETAVVTQKNVNVRGQPSLYSEVITHLKEGDKVTVLEEITPEKPKPGDPDKWARIKLPEDTHVWVFAPYVKDNAIAVPKLNLRGGPGENFSVLGRMVKGDSIKPIRTLQDWIEIEAPATASAYIAFEVIKRAPDAAETKGSNPVDVPAVIPVPVETAPAQRRAALPAPVRERTVETNSTTATVVKTNTPAANNSITAREETRKTNTEPSVVQKTESAPPAVTENIAQTNITKTTILTTNSAAPRTIAQRDDARTRVQQDAKPLVSKTVEDDTAPALPKELRRNSQLTRTLAAPAATAAPIVVAQNSVSTPVKTQPAGFSQSSTPVPGATDLKPKDIGEVPPPAKPPEETLIKRIVRREGVVRNAISIQAPTPFELVNPETHKSMDYLHGEKSGITVKHYKGQRVIVTGEEGIDPRWPNTPVLEIETIDSAP